VRHASILSEHFTESLKPEKTAPADVVVQRAIWKKWTANRLMKLKIVSANQKNDFLNLF
jgi:hypothetical protein